VGFFGEFMGKDQGIIHLTKQCLVRHWGAPLEEGSVFAQSTQKQTRSMKRGSIKNGNKKGKAMTYNGGHFHPSRSRLGRSMKGRKTLRLTARGLIKRRWQRKSLTKAAFVRGCANGSGMSKRFERRRKARKQFP